MKTLVTVKNVEALSFQKGTGFATGIWRFAESGVFNYLWWEFGLPYNESTNGIYRGYFAPEVYNTPETIASFNNVPVTLDHPFSEDGLVDLTNWDFEGVGDTGAKTVFVDNGLENEFFVRSERAVASIIAGTQELSFGATTEIELGRGKTPEGEDYDFRFVNLIGNHIAIVDRGRIPGARILTGDTDLSPSRILVGNSAGQKANGKFVIVNSNGQPMELNSPSNRKESIMIDKDTPVQITVANTDLTLPNSKLADEVKAVFNTLKDEHKTELATAVTNHETALAEVNEKLTTANTELAELKESVTPEAIALNAADRLAIINKAESLDIDLKDVDTVSNHDLRMQVLNAHENTKDADFSEDTVDTVAKVFNSLTGTTEAKPNPLSGKTVANASSTDADAQHLDNLLNARGKRT